MVSIGELLLSVVVIVVVATVFVFLFWRGRRGSQLLAQIPGPAGLPILGNLFEFFCPKDELLPKLHRWAQEYGPVFKMEVLGLQRVLLCGPEEIAVLLNCKKNLTKDYTYRFLDCWLGTGLLTSPGGKWRVRRRQLNPAFHYKILEDFVHVFNANSAILVDKLRQHTAYKYVQINEPVTLCALDIICETAMGTSVHAQKGGGVEYVRAVNRMCELFTIRLLRPWLFFNCFYRLTSYGREQEHVLKVLQDFSDKVIKKQRSEYEAKKISTKHTLQSGDKRKTFLDMLFKISDEEASWTDEDIREEVNTFMFAGHDTTAAATSWALFLLGAHQHVQDKVVAELLEIFGSDKRQPTMADLQNMTYLDQVIKEALRLFPSVPTISRILRTDFKVGKFTIPAGINTGVFVYGVHRNPDIYPDPNRFDPERFSPEQSSSRHPFAYIPFSAGPRNCIGQKFARLEEKSVISSVLRNFKLLSLDSMEDVKPLMEIVLKPHKHIRIQITKRV